MNRSLLVCLFLTALNLPVSAQAPIAEHVRAELVAEDAAIQPGRPVTVALRLDIEDGWHVYWENPGDSGMKTTISWSLPPGFEAGPLQWPYPEVVAEGPYVTYAYHGDVLAPVEIRVPAELATEQAVVLEARADWLVCKDICLPEAADLRLVLSVTTADPAPDPFWAERFRETRGLLPAASTLWTVSAAPHGEGYLLRLDPAGDAPVPSVDDVAFFALDQNVIEYSAPQLVSIDGGSVILSLERSVYASEHSDRLRGVLVATSGWEPDGRLPALEVDVPVASASFGMEAAGGAPGISLWLALVFAFVGGLILNLMPCVFPVLSLKILGFVQTAREEQTVIRRHGMVFGAGVVLSFLFLAGLLLALRAGGEELGWGFQLQTPGFVALMAFLLFVLGLSLAGVFEIGTSLIRFAGRSGSSSTYGSSFASGILATVVATPCTAPFMGSALGFALTQPAFFSLAIFGVLGLGMATPYVVLSLSPAMLRALPRPGPWMETFKQVMSFPLFATVIWLVWVFGQQTGLDGMAFLLFGLLMASLAVWILGRWPAVLIGRRVRLLTRGFALLAWAAALWFTVQGAALEAEARGARQDGSLVWQPFDEAAIEAKRAEGKPVFVDFTAAWCLSCKVNEQVALQDATVQARFEELGIELFLADWTSRDPVITRALASFGRSGVPLYVLYVPGEESPRILPEIITPGIVLDALAAVPPGPAAGSSIPTPGIVQDALAAAPPGPAAGVPAPPPGIEPGALQPAAPGPVAAVRFPS